jgi:pescadillo protein
LPQHLTLEIKKSDLEMCSTLYRDFMLYCSAAQCVTKCFLSIKGVYYRVQIMGTQVTWIQPYKFNQRLPFDVDYRVMGTFLEFYQSLLRFVNYKLFTDCGMSYPLKDMYPVS